MSKNISSVEARAVEDAAREVQGVAFAEVGEQQGRRVLRIVLWRDAPLEETAGLVELALRDSLSLEVSGGDVVVAGYADPPPVSMPQDSDLRVIDLGGSTWATESVAPHLPMPAVADAGLGPAHPRIAAVTVSRGPDRCSAKVEIEVGGRMCVAEKSGPATGSRMRQVVCEAAAQAGAEALAMAIPDVSSAGIVEQHRPCAMVMLQTAGDRTVTKAGACVIDDDPWHAFAQATLQAAISLATR